MDIPFCHLVAKHTLSPLLLVVTYDLSLPLVSLSPLVSAAFLKVSCKECKLWNSGKNLTEATPAQRKYVHDRVRNLYASPGHLLTILVFQVIDECPGLKGHKMEIDFALGKALINNKFYVKKKEKEKEKVFI